MALTQTVSGDREREAFHDRGREVEAWRSRRISNSVLANGAARERAICGYIDNLERQAHVAGMRLELEDDFGLLAEITPHLDRAPLTHQFNPAYSDVGPTNAFWLRGVDAKGEIVQTQAVRVDDYRATTLYREFESLRAFYADPSVHADPNETCVVSAPAAHIITGRVCYHGEFWIKRSSGLRGAGLGYILTRMAIALAFARWAPDFVYATVIDALVKKGLAARYGYRNIQPGGMYRVVPSTDEVLDEWLIWMTQRDIIDMIDGDAI